MKNKGITLIALVITIIIMLILVAVTITTTLGDNGIIGRTQKAAFEEDIAKYREELALYVSNAKADAIVNNMDFIDITEWDYDTIIAEKYIPSLDIKYSGRIGIIDSKLAFLDTEDRKSKWATNIDGLIIKSKEAKIKVCIEGEGDIQGIEKINEEIVSKVGKEYTLKAIAKTKQDVNYTFVEWQKDGKRVCTNENYTFQVGGDSTYTAVFTPEATIITYLNGETEQYCIDRTSNLATYMSQKDAIGVENITKVEFGNYCTEIPGDAFNGCTKITKINLNNVTRFSGGMAFGNCINLEEIIAPKLNTIGNAGFINDEKLKKVTLGSKENAFESMIGATFRGTPENMVIKIYMDMNKENVDLSDNWGEAKYSTIEYYNAETGNVSSIFLGRRYKGNTQISWDEIPNKEHIMEIKSEAFKGCTGLTGEITIPDNITKIASGTFSGCTGITKINLNNVETIEGHALAYCSNLEEIIALKAKVIKNPAFFFDEKLKKVVLGSIDNPVQSIGMSTFRGTKGSMILQIYIDSQEESNILSDEPWEANYATIEYYNADTGNIENIILGQKYKGNTEIEWEQIPNNNLITAIRDSAFQGCTGLTKIDLSNITNIQARAFKGCTGLTGEITIPDNITKIEAETFSGCTGITKINLNNVEKIGGYALGYCSNLEEIIAPKAKIIENPGFFYDEKLKEVILGSIDNPVQSIGMSTFRKTPKTMSVKIYIDTAEGNDSLPEEPWEANKQSIEYYDSKTGDKIN